MCQMALPIIPHRVFFARLKKNKKKRGFIMKTVVQLSKLAEEMKLKNLTPEICMDEVEITSQEINRPALQLAGY